jgi:hypothetical protein
MLFENLKNLGRFAADGSLRCSSPAPGDFSSHDASRIRRKILNESNLRMKTKPSQNRARTEPEASQTQAGTEPNAGRTRANPSRYS